MIVVGLPPHPSLIGWGDILATPPVEPANGTEEARWVAIREAMCNAVRLADLGEPIFQYDVECYGDPAAADPTPGAVRLLTAPRSHRHACPRGFIIYDESTRHAVLEAWQYGKGRACTAWRDIPKVTDYLPGRHDTDRVAT